MHVIGTAGHVDHGKTALIEALTGINPDRLPEEMQRGMTIDLGFAWFPGSDGQPIGVIDVPGHERFIRNMVAGAWSLSAALLVVAADDGWMQQTTDHIQVLACLRVRRLIVVVSKTDLVSSRRLEEVSGRAAAASARWGYAGAPVVEVSAKTGHNIDRLRQAVMEVLVSAPGGAAAPAVPHLFVDRVFVLQGSGAIVTGSLRGGPLERSGDLLQLPQGRTLRVRHIQSYHADVERALPVSRLALNLQGVKKEEIRRGDCLTVRVSPPGAQPIGAHREFIAEVYPPLEPRKAEPGRRWLRNDMEMEFALGTGHWTGRVYLLAREGFVRVVLAEPAPMYWNQPFLMIHQGGSELAGGGRVLWTGPTTREERARLAALLPGVPAEPGAEDLFGLRLRLDGLARTASADAARSPADGTGSGSADAAGRPEETVALDGWVFLREKYAAFEAEVLKLASAPGGAAAGELRSRLGADPEAVDAVVRELVRRGRAELRQGLLFRAGVSPEANLDPPARQLLGRLRAAGKTGLELKGLDLPGAQKEFRSLVRVGLAVSLDGNLMLAAEHYRRLAAETIGPVPVGKTFGIPEAKERTGLSRKYMLPLLNKMETEGLVRREGDLRRVLRRPDGPPAAAPGRSGEG